VTEPDLAVVLAGAGEGQRMGGGPKAVFEIGGRTLLERVAATFLAHPAVGEVVAAVPDRLLERSRALLAGLPNPRGVRVAAVVGGATRQESVRRGLEALERDLAFVAVHDVARANVSGELIGRVLDAARATGAAIPALPLRDTVKEVKAGYVTRTVPRERLQAAQTPQIFARDILARAHAVAAGGKEHAAATDDAALVESVGAAVQVVPGDPENWKLTEPSDVALLASRLDAGESR
jgi:2-C-methyl-D-erythritol 4-phosphate cytidylyltransferase